MAAFESRGSDPRRLLPETLEDRLLGWAAQAAGGLLVTIGAVGWLGPADLVGERSEPDPRDRRRCVRNWLGSPGAIASDLLLQTLGFAAVFVLLPPVIWGLELMLVRRVPDFRSKICLFPLAIVLLAGGLLGAAGAGALADASWPRRHHRRHPVQHVEQRLQRHQSVSAAAWPRACVFAGTGFGALVQQPRPAAAAISPT